MRHAKRWTSFVSHLAVLVVTSVTINFVAAAPLQIATRLRPKVPASYDALVFRSTLTDLWCL